MELNENTQPHAYEVKDDDNLEEKDLRRTFLFGSGDEEKQGDEPGLEGSPAGGQRFGENSNTPSGDDKNNPSQLAGNTNGYFARTEPSDEHPENNNFKDPNQLGQPNYTQAADAAKTGQSDTENTGPTKEDDPDVADAADNKNESEVSYQEGTADGADVNIPGPNEVPDQQKVGE
nr:hypothetical protein [uncultured Mucilaginibacter sp.]